uniref:ATP synthase F0 subunit 8 n=1 Tax=Metallus mai TaxID=2782261 RepID=A0A7T5Y190_9HYME|nr:ATP synthase F0 subunit 8 [Metallus mai]
MPQMFPMLWTMLYLFFLFIFLNFIIINYFNYTLFIKLNNKKNNFIIKKINWKW